MLSTPPGLRQRFKDKVKFSKGHPKRYASDITNRQVVDIMNGCPDQVAIQGRGDFLGQLPVKMQGFVCIERLRLRAVRGIFLRLERAW